MENINVPAINVSVNPFPTYGTKGAAGMDLYSTKLVTLQPFERVLIPTGVSIALPEGYELQVRARSGLTLKQGLVVANGVGTIDSDYRGDIGVILYNISGEPQTVNPGDRIAQAVVTSYVRVEWEPVLFLPETNRGSGGFGSTGVSTNL